VWKNLGHKFHILKQTNKKSVSTYIQKHLICELQIKEYNYNKCSKCPLLDSVHTWTYLTMDCRIYSKMSRIFKPINVDLGGERAVQTPDMEKHVLHHVDRDAGVSTGEVED
jgi:hypothetical protein